MDLFELNITDAERAEIETLRSQNNVARATLWHRIDKGLTQTELASLAETTQARVSEIEALKGDPKLSTLARVARALGCMIDMVPVPAVVPGATTLALLSTQGSSSDMWQLDRATFAGASYEWTKPT